MPTPLTKLPFPGPLDKNLAEYFTSQGGVELINGILDVNGGEASLETRPGLVEDQLFPSVSGIDGLFYWPAKKKYVAVADGIMYASDPTTSKMIVMTTPGDSIQRGPVQFAATASYLYIASTSGRMLRWDGVSAAARVMEEDAPGNVCSVAYLNGRVIAAEQDSNRVWFTKPHQVDQPALILEWVGYFDVIRSTDKIQALVAFGTELLIFKTLSAEFWYDDGTTPLRPVPGGSFMLGLASPRGFAVTDNTIFWVNLDRKVFMMTGRTPQNISGTSVDRMVQNFPTVEDVVVSYTDRFVIFTFPRADKTLVFDMKIGVWYQWSFLENGVARAYLGKHSVRTTQGEWLLGGRDNQTYFMNSEKFTDGMHPCQMIFRSPHYDHNSQMFKSSSRTIIKVSQRTVSGMFIELADAVRCHAYSYQLPKSAFYRYRLLGGLPDGFSFDESTATITATATDRELGTYTARFKATDTTGRVTLTTATIKVVDFDPIIWEVV